MVNHACHCVPRKLAPFNQQDTGRCNPQNALERRSIALNELRHRIQCIAAVGLQSSMVLAGYLPVDIAIASDMRSSATGRWTELIIAYDACIASSARTTMGQTEYRPGARSGCGTEHMIALCNRSRLAKIT